jgi:hypothetical protein
LKDELEVGLRPDAPYRKENLPELQQDDPACDEAARPDDSPGVERACGESDEAPAAPERRRRTRRQTVQ